MSSSKNGLLLLTGGTGFIGFRSLVFALKAGWKVRAAIRSEKKKEGILNAPSLKTHGAHEGMLEFVVVEDITAPGAYDEAMKGVTHVLHVASPLASQNPEGYKNADEVFIKPAVLGVTNILNAAKSAGSVKKVVITSSVVALMQPKVWGGFEISDVHFTGKTRTHNVEGPYQTPGQAYCASKIASLNETDKWVETEKPQFDVINIHPSWVLGPTDSVPSREEFMKGTNKYLVAVALNKVKEISGDRRMTGAVVHVDDVAQVQVLALEPNVSGYKSYITSIPFDWQGIAKKSGELFPEQVKKGELSTQGEQPTASIFLDASDTEKEFGFKFLGATEIVRDTVDSYLSLPAVA